MCARRGTPKHMHSDNGTNFVGAAKQLNEDFKQYRTFLSPEFNDEICNMQIEWHFNAPLWPTAGGLWEAAVKSMKYHLRRVIGEQKLTYEQFSTLLAEIEACMNSRPLTALTEDTDDLEYLTPGHFLVGGPVMSLPQEDNDDFSKHDLRNRWRLVEQMNQHFWRRWSNEYLQEMQVRSKWQKPTKNLEEGDLVLVKENNMPPGKWAMGRVEEIHPGSDGYVRVVTIKTKGGQLKRPITKLVPLFAEEETKNLEKMKTNKQNETTDSEQRDKKTEKNSKKLKFSCFTLLNMFFMMICMMGTACSAQTGNFKITPIKNDHPIYFDETGHLQLVHDEWTLLVYYNLTTYWKATKDINFYIEQIHNRCTLLSHVPCNVMVDQLRHELRHLSENNDLLLSQRLPRKKRGYINGIGNLARTFFGVLDEDFAKKYEQDIDALQSNENYLLKLMKNQTLIVEAENNIIKKNEKFMETQFHNLHAYMREAGAEITRIDGRVNFMITMNDVTAASLTASLIITNLRRTQDLLLNALSDIYKGHLDMHLFPASQLIGQLGQISSQLPKGLSLPIRNYQQNFQEIYNLIYVKARVTDNYVLFELHIPLTSHEEFVIYRMIPIPFNRDDHLSVVIRSSTYIAINFEKNSYMSMDHEDMEQCTTFSDNNFVCNARQPVYNLHNKNAPCEAKVFSQQTTLSCVTHEVQCYDKWIKLHQMNVWLYICCKKHLIRIICDEKVTSTAINGTGLISLRQGCILQRPDATIYAYNHFGSRINLKEDIEVPTIDSSINNMLQTNWQHTQLKIADTGTSASIATDLAKIDRQVSFQKEHEALPTSSLSPHDIHHYTVSSLLVGGVLVGALYYLIKNRKKNPVSNERTKEQEPVAQGIELQILKSSSRPSRQETQRPDPSFNFD